MNQVQRAVKRLARLVPSLFCKIIPGCSTSNSLKTIIFFVPCPGLDTQRAINPCDFRIRFSRSSGFPSKGVECWRRDLRGDAAPQNPRHGEQCKANRGVEPATVGWRPRPRWPRELRRGLRVLLVSRYSPAASEPTERLQFTQKDRK